jgi:RimJ/RimL family protein N-acetyltransferase
MPSDRDALEIGPVPAPRAAEAFELILRDLAEPDRREQVRTFLSGSVSWEGLLAARRGERLVGAIFSQIQPGRIAIVWPPRLAPGEPDETADRLLEAADRGLAAAGVSMAQVLLETVSEADDTVLFAEGYRPLAKLLYLVCGEDEFPASRPGGPLEFEPYTESDRDRLARLIEATYEATLDCPQLNDVRCMDDILEGYRQTGAFDPERWLIVRHQDRDVGCLIVTDHPEHGSCELVYMGIAAGWRGHGWGKEIARFAQWLTARVRRPRLVLAVDAANAPAITMYESVGFHAWDRRTVYGKLFDSRG